MKTENESEGIERRDTTVLFINMSIPFFTPPLATQSASGART